MTLIYQSYRTHNVPLWISRCLQSVQSWSRDNGYEYRFIDDTLFEYAPDWYRQKVQNNVQLVSDLSRLLLARKFLQEGFQRVIWIDADMLIFKPESFQIEATTGASFCREIWVDADKEGTIIHQKKINNSVSVFHQQAPLLDFYIEACLKIVETSDKITPVLVGTAFLTELNKIYPLSLLRNVGIISPALVCDILSCQNDFIDKYQEWHGSPVYAANLCGSMDNKTFNGVKINENAMEKVVEKLLQHKGLPRQQHTLTQTHLTFRSS